MKIRVRFTYNSSCDGIKPVDMCLEIYSNHNMNYFSKMIVFYSVFANIREPGFSKLNNVMTVYNCCIVAVYIYDCHFINM